MRGRGTIRAAEWVMVTIDGGRVRIMADSECIDSKGFALLIRVLDDRPADGVLDAHSFFIQEIRLSSNLFLFAQRRSTIRLDRSEPRPM
jgi:hypothetical protein